MASRFIAVVAALLLPAAAWAGVTIVSNPPKFEAAAPAMGEPGLILLGLCLVGTGIAILRRR
jgi:hypothetical protein